MAGCSLVVCVEQPCDCPVGVGYIQNSGQAKVKQRTCLGTDMPKVEGVGLHSLMAVASMECLNSYHMQEMYYTVEICPIHTGCVVLCLMINNLENVSESDVHLPHQYLLFLLSQLLFEEEPGVYSECHSLVKVGVYCEMTLWVELRKALVNEFLWCACAGHPER